MRSRSYFLLVGITVLLAVGCSYRGKSQKQQIYGAADCGQQCASIAQPWGLQKFRSKISEFVGHQDQPVHAPIHEPIAVARPGIKPAMPPFEAATSMKVQSVDAKTDYSIKELVPYENTQLKIAVVKPQLSTVKSSRIAYQAQQKVSPHDEFVAMETDQKFKINWDELGNESETRQPNRETGTEVENKLVPHTPPTDELTSPTGSILELISSLAPRSVKPEFVDDPTDNLIWHETSEPGDEQGILVEAETVADSDSAIASEEQVSTGKVERPIVLRARPQYRGRFIDEITRRKSTQPIVIEPEAFSNDTVEQSLEMDPGEFQQLPEMQSAKVAKNSDQPIVLSATNPDFSTPIYAKKAASMPNMVPIATQQPSLQATTPQFNSNVPMIQASSKKILEAIPQRIDSATRLLQQKPVASPLLDNPYEVLRLRATTGLSANQHYPPIVRFKTNNPTDIQSREANQFRFSKPHQIELLPRNLDETRLPSSENAPMIDHSRVDESIRRLTVRPESENQSTEQTIDR